MHIARLLLLVTASLSALVTATPVNIDADIITRGEIIEARDTSLFAAAQGTVPDAQTGAAGLSPLAVVARLYNHLREKYHRGVDEGAGVESRWVMARQGLEDKYQGEDNATLEPRYWRIFKNKYRRDEGEEEEEEEEEEEDASEDTSGGGPGISATHWQQFKGKYRRNAIGDVDM